MGIKVGLVGTGVMGTQHARLLATGLVGCELVAIADVDVEKTRRIAEELGAPRTTPMDFLSSVPLKSMRC